MPYETHDFHCGKGVALDDIPNRDAIGCEAVHRNVYGGERVGTLVAVHKDWCVVDHVSGLIAVNPMRVPCATVFVLVEDADGNPIVRNQWALHQPEPEAADEPEPPAVDTEPEPEPEAPKRTRRKKAE